MTLGEVAAAMDGRLVGADPDTVVTGSVEFDSRLVQPGGLFVALAGEHADGHDFVAQASDRGAIAAIVTRQVAAPSIEVRDGFAALAALASTVVRHLPDTVVIGVTGSSGKTSTKDMLAHVLAQLGPTVAPPGSFNNELGHPYTVLRADESTRFLVLETSARGIGHIRYLTEIAPPRIGVELNVGSAHLGEFGSRAAIAQAKGELLEALPSAEAGGVAVLNADDPMVLSMSGRTSARIVTFGRSASAAISADAVELDELGRARFAVRHEDDIASVALRFAGEHQVGNALACIAVALECGADLASAAAWVSEAAPASRWRMEVHERADGLLVVNDAYNANPESMRAALEALAAMSAQRAGAGGRSFAVLGHMAELGPAGEAEHRALGRLAAELDIARIVAVGAAARPVADEATLQGSWRGTATWVPDSDAAIGLLRSELRPSDVVLVKASRAASLERVAQAIADDGPHTTDSTPDGPGGTAA